jgi:hypothetical protein
MARLINAPADTFVVIVREQNAAGTGIVERVVFSGRHIECQRQMANIRRVGLADSLMRTYAEAKRTGAILPEG